MNQASSGLQAAQTNTSLVAGGGSAGPKELFATRRSHVDGGASEVGCNTRGAVDIRPGDRSGVPAFASDVGPGRGDADDRQGVSQNVLVGVAVVIQIGRRVARGRTTMVTPLLAGVV